MFLASISDQQMKNIVKPINDIVTQFVPVFLALICTVGAIYCIVLGVKFALADDPQEHEKAKKALIYAIIGFVAIFVLLCMLHVGTGILTEYYNDTLEAK